MFVGRERELKTLNKFYKRDNFELVLLYGRRRVGKTELLTQFIKDKNALFFVAEETTRKINLKKLSETYSDFIKIPSILFDEWETFFSSIAQLSKNEKLVFVIDEFPYLVAQDKGFMSKLQHIIDHQLRDTNVMLILCGSSISFMEEILGEKSPIFGRVTGQILLKPFAYYHAIQMLPNLENKEKLESYFILGGIPEYLKYFNHKRNLDELIVEYLFDSSESLFNTPNNLLKQELRNPSLYNAILESIAAGASKPNEIMTKIGVAPAVGQKYLETLIGLHLLEKLAPISNKSRRKSIYKVSDSLFEFVYRFCYRYRTQIEAGNGLQVYNKFVQPVLKSYFGMKFEKVCLEYMENLNSQGKLNDYYLEVGKWWGGNPQTKVEEEIDIVCMNDQSAIYGECKYKSEKLNMLVLEDLKRKSLIIPRKEMHYYLFSKSGFTQELIDYANNSINVVLVNLEDILNI